MSEEWIYLDDFLKTITSVDGYSEEGILNGEIFLDKDIKSNDKIYSVDNCTFVDKTTNNKYKPNQMRYVIGTNMNNESFEFYNQSDFAKTHNLRQSTISDCLKGRVKKHKGWTFIYK